jgi:hypothetical protein
LKENFMLRLTTLLVATLLLAFNCATVTAQQQTGAIKSDELQKEISEKKRRALENGNPLIELEFLRPYWGDSTIAPDVQQSIGYQLLNASAQIGNYAEALKYADEGRQWRAYKGRQMDDPKQLEGFKPTDALKAVLQMSDSAQIILINEAHHVPQHRAFIYELLKALRQKGFTHFASETLSEKDAGLNERGYPTKATGFYTVEPVYGDLVRNAHKLGYRIVPYEWVGNYTPDNREHGQAKNLFERILKNNPKAKILVHAGYDHINETGTLVGAKTMAQRLKEITGIDPLTIDQTVMTEHSTPEYEHPLYRYVMETNLISRPSIFRNDKGEWWTLEKGKRDLTLISPRSSYKDGRPTWLRLGGNRKPYKLPKNICETASPCLVRARLAGESTDAVPVDQVEVAAKRGIPVLMLPAGDFVLEVKDATDKVLKTSRIKIR